MCLQQQYMFVLSIHEQHSSKCCSKKRQHTEGTVFFQYTHQYSDEDPGKYQYWGTWYIQQDAFRFPSVLLLSWALVQQQCNNSLLIIVEYQATVFRRHTIIDEQPNSRQHSSIVHKDETVKQGAREVTGRTPPGSTT